MVAQRGKPQTEAQTGLTRSSGSIGKAAMKADRAAIDTANLNLSYATIRSPTDGISALMDEVSFEQNGTVVRMRKPMKSLDRYRTNS